MHCFFGFDFFPTGDHGFNAVQGFWSTGRSQVDMANNESSKQPGNQGMEWG
jgi:hypothetical protein